MSIDELLDTIEDVGDANNTLLDTRKILGASIIVHDDSGNSHRILSAQYNPLTNELYLNSVKIVSLEELK